MELTGVQSKPKATWVRKAVQASWDDTEKYYQEYIPKMTEMLAKYMGQRVWKDGYYPVKTTFIEECSDYSTVKGFGAKTDMKIEETYAQRFFPLFHAYEKAVNEIKDIKSKWWYKLLNLIGLAK